MKKFLLPASLLVFSFSAPATLVINFDGYANGNEGVVTTGINFGTSAHTTLATTNVADDTVRSTIAYGTTLLTNGAGTYTGPTMQGGLYMNAIYNEAQLTSTFQNNWASMLNHVDGDYLQLRRNGGTGSTTDSTNRGVFTFDAGGNFSLADTTTFNLTGGAPNVDTSHWVVINDGTTYISQTQISLSSSNTTGHTFEDPDTTLWAEWTPNGDLSNLPDFTSTVNGSTLTNVSQAGFYFERTGSMGLNPVFRQFSVEVIPEPGSLALVGIALVTLLFLRRRR